MISKVLPGGQAEALHLQVGDVLLQYGDRPIESDEDLRAAKGTPAEQVKLTLLRGGKELTVTLPGGSSIGVLTETCYQ